MLCLGRRVGQSILIGRNIRITITKASATGKKVRLAIEAPENLTILREELVEPALSKQREGK